MTGSTLTKREAFQAAGRVALGASAVAALGIPGVAGAAQAKQWGMLIDLRRCIGCKACSVACKAENDVPLGVFRRRVRTRMEGTYPAAKRHFLPISCFHCAKPACLAKCPEKAISKVPEGYVVIDKDKCKKKKVCTVACPYSNIFINPVTEKADKCTFCEHRVKNGLVPACVNTCQGEAILFGDLQDADSDIAKAVKANKAEVLKPDAGTEPSFYYIGLPAGIDAILKRGQEKPETLDNDR